MGRRGWTTGAAMVAACLASSSIASEPAWIEIAGNVDAALARHLSGAERQRLLARDDVRRALRAALDGWDGRDDTLVAEKGADGVVVLRIVVADRRRECDLVRSSESEVGPPVCREVLDARPAQEIVLAPTLWRAPKPRPRTPPAPTVADAGPAPDPEPEPEPTPRVDLIVPSGAPFDRARLEAYAVTRAPAVHDALLGYARFLEDLERGGRRDQDPFLPDDRVLAATAMEEARPEFGPTLGREGGAEATLRDPFGAGRMQTAIPVPDMLRLGKDGQAPDPVPMLDDECRTRWEMRERAEVPPELDCFQRSAHNFILFEDNAGLEAIHDLQKFIGFGISMPILDQIVAVAKQDAASHQAYHAVWALVWLSWVEAHPGQLADALGRLDERERKVLRRRLWRWWIRPEMARWRPMVTAIYERHFVRLYPEARDAAGLPRAAWFKDQYLWASNWLSVADERAPAAIVAAYDRLGPRERAIIDGFVADEGVAQRFASSCEALRGRSR